MIKINKAFAQQSHVGDRGSKRSLFTAMNMFELTGVLDGIISAQNLVSVYQPIVNIRKKNIHGYESLIRGPSNSPLHSPVALFDVAERANRLYELESICHQLAAEGFVQQNLPGKVFMNTSPATILQAGNHPDQILRLLEKIGMAPERVVIELTEQYPLDDYEVIRQATLHYRAMGFEVAIDDLGAGYSGLRLWSELRPDYVKIDRHFIQSIHEDPVKQEFIHSILDIARSLECNVIAEGIETIDEFKVICEMGIEFGQGYYFARPHNTPITYLNENLFVCDKGRAVSRRHPRLSESVSLLLRKSPCVEPSAKLEDVVDIFCRNKSLVTIPVVSDDMRPIGRVRRNVLMDMFVNPFGRSLYGSKPIKYFMEENPVVIDKVLSVEDASQLITDNSRLAIEDDFIMVADGCYAGIGKVVDLLKKITELQIRNARYANPLTMLPGNVPIYELVDQMLNEGKTFTIAYCDLDYFKPFNDVYGYKQGDEVLRKVAEIFNKHTEHESDFVGHVGGDDFIIIFQSEDWLKRCRAMLMQFEEEIVQFYPQADRQRGGILSKDRQGREQFFNLLSLSIGTVTPDINRCHSHHDVAALASEAKQKAKKIMGNSLFMDRRAGPSRV